MTFKDLFSSHAADYARYRPTYPAELFAWLAIASPATGLAVDVGTGDRVLSAEADLLRADDRAAALVRDDAVALGDPLGQQVGQDRVEPVGGRNRAPDVLICFLRWAFRERPSIEITLYTQIDHFSWIYHDVFHALHHTKRLDNTVFIRVDKYCEWEAMRYGFRATLTEYDGELPPAEATMFEDLWKEYTRRFYWFSDRLDPRPTKKELFGMDF